MKLSKELRQSLSDGMLEMVPPMSNVIGISGNMIREWAAEVRKLEGALSGTLEEFTNVVNVNTEVIKAQNARIRKLEAVEEAAKGLFHPDYLHYAPAEEKLRDALAGLEDGDDV